MRADEVVELLELEPLPDEGGRWAQTWSDEHSTAIYFLMTPDDFSAMHRLTSTEVWHHYAGAPVLLVLLSPDGAIEQSNLGDDLASGERPCAVVRGGVWMGASTTGEWSLVGTTMAPPWDEEQFELGVRERLIAAYPGAADHIRRLTRVEST